MRFRLEFFQLEGVERMKKRQSNIERLDVLKKCFLEIYGGKNDERN